MTSENPMEVISIRMGQGGIERLTIERNSLKVVLKQGAALRPTDLAEAIIKLAIAATEERKAAIAAGAIPSVNTPQSSPRAKRPVVATEAML